MKKKYKFEEKKILIWRKKKINLKKKKVKFEKKILIKWKKKN
jgi:hypothetical protein